MNLIKFIITSIILVSCNNKSDRFYFKEVGTLLWVNETMSDSLVKLVVKETLENSSIVVSQISWSPTDSLFTKNAEWYHSLAIESGKSFMLNIDWLKNDRSGIRGDIGFDNDKIKSKFIKDIINLVDLYNPNYLTLGVEVNYYALTSPTGYIAFIELFNKLKSDINKKFPKTKIGLSFQLELIYGIHKDWQKNKTLEPLYAVVENLDYIGISTYPDISIPNQKNPLFSVNYLDSLASEFNEPIGITETGISSINFNLNQRVCYTKTIFKKAENLNFNFVIWGSIIDDINQFGWKNTFGLINSKGVHKPEFDIWKQNNKKINKN